MEIEPQAALGDISADAGGSGLLKLVESVCARSNVSKKLKATKDRGRVTFNFAALECRA